MTLLSLHNIKYLYNSKESSGISNLSLTIKRGEITSLIGPSGSGKTTIQKIVSGELTPQQGSIEKNDIKIFSKTNLNNEDFNDLDPINYLTQDIKDIEKARELLFKFEITNTVYRKSSDLSNGEKQRLALAKLFMNDFDLLICDEIFSGIDYNNRQIILKIIKDLLIETKRSLIWSTQLCQDALKFSDVICVLQFGQVEQIDKPEVVFFKPRTLFVAQFFGPINVFLIKNSAQGVRTTFKEIKEVTLEHEGLAIVKPEYIKLGSEYECELESSVFNGNAYLNTATYKSETLYFYSINKLHSDKVELDIALNQAHILTEI
mgnify:CR=1 FL=1